MKKYTLTIGLNDKDTERREISVRRAKKVVSDILINQYNIYAYTLTKCEGVYRMTSTGHIIAEKSLRAEIASESEIPVDAIIATLKWALNQESIMVEISDADISFR